MRNPIGMHSSLWWGTSIANNIHQVIEHTARTTADCMEISPTAFLSLSSAERKQLKRFADDCGVALNVNGGVGAEFDISSADTVIRSNGIERVSKIIEATADMEIAIWSGCMFAGYCTKPNGNVRTDKARARAQSIASMQILLTQAKSHGITLAPELLNRYEQYIINTVEEGVSYCNDTGFDNCKLLIDTFHMTIEENNLHSAIHYAQANGKIGYIHVGETNRRVPTGDASNINWHSFADTIRSCHYDGMVVIEPFELTTAHNALSVCVWRDYSDPNNLDSILKKAKQGVAFLRSL